MTSRARERADRLLVERGLAESRERAQALILAGVVRTGTTRVEKAGDRLPMDAPLHVVRDPNPYVSRGGLKMEAALAEFGVDPTGFAVLDVGASTGGFTDCLLAHGARRVHAVDVGRGQLHWKLRNDPRVVPVEGVNARYLEPGHVEGPIDLVTVDVAFISLRLIVPAVRAVVTAHQWIVLVKPQFEVGKGQVERGGLVTDPDKHRAVLGSIAGMAASVGLACSGIIPSPIRGAEGNREFLLHLRGSGPPTEARTLTRWIQEATG